MAENDSRLTISDVARRTGVTRRTIRYYVEIGLLPPPSGGGRAAVYGEEHVERLALIKDLQAMRLSLDEIREYLAKGAPAPPGTFRAMELQSPAASGPQLSASEYVANLRRRFALAEPHALAARPTTTPPDHYEAEQWLRIVLAPDVELNVRRRGSRLDRRISKLIKEARRILEEEEPK